MADPWAADGSSSARPEVPHGDGRPPQAGRHPRLAALAAGLVSLALLGIIVLMLNRREVALDAVRRGAENLALATAEQTARSVQAVDVVLLDLQMHATEAATASAASVHEAAGAAAFASWLRSSARHLPQIEALLVARADGTVIVAAGQIPPARQEALAREAIRNLAAGDAGQLFVGTPEPGAAPADEALMVTLARLLQLPDGAPAGVVLAVLRLDAFGSLYAALQLPEHGIVALLRRDGTLLVRQPPLPRGGLRVPAGDPWHGLVAQGGGTFRSPGVFDARARLISLRPLREYPLVTVVGVDEHAALAGWRRDALLTGAGAFVAVTCILLLLRALRQQFRRLESSQGSLEAANRHLSQKSRELETTLAYMDQGLMFVDADRTVPVCNRRAVEMLDLPAEMMARRPTFDQVLTYQWSTDEFRHTASDVQAFIRAGGILDKPQTYERRRPNGRMIEVRSVPLEGGGVVRTYTDTTARVLGEERFRRIVDDCPLAIALLSTGEERFVQVNPACCALVGRPPDQLVGRPWQDIIHPDDRSGLVASRALAEGRVTEEARLLTRSGGVVWTRLTRSLLPGGPGRQPLVLAIGEDVTPQRDMEARLRQAQRLEAVGQLTGGVAHDFNNLLAIIMLDAEMLAEAAADDPERAHLAEEILATAGSGAELTRRLLAFARRQTLQPTSMDLNAYVAEAASLLSRTLGEAVQVRLDLAANLWPLRADASQVGDALLNLALNARDAMPGGGTLTISTANVQVSGPPEGGVPGGGARVAGVPVTGERVSGERVGAEPVGGEPVGGEPAGGAGLSLGTVPQTSGGPSAAGRVQGAPVDARADLVPGAYVALTVTDTGSGMRSDVLERAVEPFFTTKPPGSGSGLGLSMIYGFARQSGGTLVLDSTPGAGTSVRLLLPRAQVGMEAVATGTSPAGLPGGRETVLLVDDNEAVRHVALRHLEALGYAVCEADSGPAALAVLRSGVRVDLLFTDIVMPGGMSGLGLAQAARQERPSLKVLFTTGFARVGEDGTEPEPSPLLRKPYRRQALAEHVRAVLDA